MNSLNSILIEGNVVRDPVVRETPKGTLVCLFSIASNRFYRQDEGLEKETSFFDVESWSKLAETCEKNCIKGRGVRVVGRLKQDRWTGTDGKNYYKVKVVAEHIEFKPQFRIKDGANSESDTSSDFGTTEASITASHSENELSPSTRTRKFSGKQKRTTEIPTF